MGGKNERTGDEIGSKERGARESERKRERERKRKSVGAREREAERLKESVGESDTWCGVGQEVKSTRDGVRGRGLWR